MNHKKEKSLFGFILSDPNLNFWNKLECFGFIIVMILFVVFLVYQFFYIGLEKMSVFWLFTASLFIVYELNRIYFKFIVPYLNMKEDDEFVKKASLGTNKTNKLVKGGVKFNIKTEMLSLLLFVPILCFFLVGFLESYFNIEISSLLLVIFFSIITVVSFMLYAILSIRTWKEMNKIGKEFDEEVEAVLPPVYKKIYKSIGLALLVLLSIIATIIFINSENTIENCKEIYKEQSDINACFKKNAKVAAKKLDIYASGGFCNEVYGKFEKLNCFKEIASEIAQKNLNEAYEFCDKFCKTGDLLVEPCEKNNCFFSATKKLSSISDKIKMCDIVYQKNKEYLCYMQLASEYPKNAQNICEGIENQKDKDFCIKSSTYAPIKK